MWRSLYNGHGYFEMRKKMKQRDLTTGNITKNLMLFALPMMAGNLLQQCYNIADTLIVGRYLGQMRWQQ